MKKEMRNNFPVGWDNQLPKWLGKESDLNISGLICDANFKTPARNCKKNKQKNMACLDKMTGL